MPARAPHPPPSSVPASCPLYEQALQILDNEEQQHVPRVLVFDHTASGVSRDAIAASQVRSRGGGRGHARMLAFARMLDRVLAWLQAECSASLDRPVHACSSTPPAPLL